MTDRMTRQQMSDDVTINRAADILAKAGAYCGQCCFGECGEPDCPRDADWRGCPDCAEVVNGYARALAEAGLLTSDHAQKEKNND